MTRSASPEHPSLSISKSGRKRSLLGGDLRGLMMFAVIAGLLVVLLAAGCGSSAPPPRDRSESDSSSAGAANDASAASETGADSPSPLAGAANDASAASETGADSPSIGVNLTQPSSVTESTPTSCPTPRYSSQGDLPEVKLPASKGAFLVRHTLVNVPPEEPEWIPEVDQWPTPLEEIKERTPYLFWGFVIDLACEAEDFEFHGYTRWRNITDPDRPSAGSEGDPVVLTRDAGGSGLAFFYEIRGWGNMSPGTYQFQLLDESLNDVFSWDFRVVENTSSPPASAGLSLDQYGSKLPNIQLPNIVAPLISHGLEPTLYNVFDASLDWRVVRKMVGADLLNLTWLLEFDTTAAPMNLPFAAEVRWVDVTNPNRPVDLSGADQGYQGTGFGRSYYRASRGTGELGYWKPGRYQVRLIDRNSGEILAYLSFEVN